jgi:hypothetical protein
VVTVGDQGLPRRQVAGHPLVQRGVLDRPDPLGQAVLGSGLQGRRPGRDLVQHRSRVAATVVHEQDRLQVGSCRAHQLEPVGDRPGHDVLVRQDDPVGRVVQPHRRQQAALEHPRPGLLVDVERGPGVAAQDPLGPPPVEQLGGVRVPAGADARCTAPRVAWQDQPDHVVRVELLQVGRVVGIDHVVRRAGDGRQVAHPGRHVPDPPERRHQQPVRRCGPRGPMAGGDVVGGRHGEDGTGGRDGDGGAGPVTENSAREGGEPAGEVYDWYVRGRTLLEGGNPEAAAELLRHAFEREPDSASVLEAFARALFDARRYGEAAERFTELVETSPDSDYARFGLGLSRMRLGDLTAAVEQLALATAMRPERAEYQQALREARATVRAREDAGLTGPPDLRGGPLGGDPPA